MAKKVFKESDMYPASRTRLRDWFPAADGWEIVAQDHHGTYIPDFVITRRTWWGAIKKAVAEVKKCQITQADIDQLNAYARNLAGPNVSIVAKIFIVAAGAYTVAVPSDIEVIYLRSFNCNDL